MTAYAPTTAAPRPQLVLVTLIVLAVHALLLGLPHWWARSVPVAGDPPVFQIRTVALAQPQIAAAPTQTVPQPPPPRAKSRPAPRPKPPPAPDNPEPSVADVQPSIVPVSARTTDAPPSLLQAPPLAVFGGTMPLPPIIPPLPPDQALAVQQQAAQPSPANAPDTRTPGTPDPAAPVRLPHPAEIVYQTTFTLDGRRIALPSTINWRHDGQFYDLRWTLYGPAIGDHSRTTTGLITVHGLAPVTARSMGPNAYALTFDYAHARLHGEPPTSASVSASGAAAMDATSSPLPAASASDRHTGTSSLPPGAQDPLSLLIELGALIAGDPARYPVGSRIALPVADGSGPIPQADFTIVDDDDLAVAGQFAGRRLSALHLVHEPANDRDARIELWLGKQLDYLPIRLLVIRPGGEQIDTTLQSAHTQTVQPSSTSSAAAGASATPVDAGAH